MTNQAVLSGQEAPSAALKREILKYRRRARIRTIRERLNRWAMAPLGSTALIELLTRRV